MSSFYTETELCELGLKRIGSNVLISRKVSIYSADKITIGNNVRIDDFCILSGKIAIGDYVHIAAYCGLFAGEVGIEIKNFAGVSSRCMIYALSDDYSGEFMTNPTVPDKYKNIISKKVTLGEHSLIGTSSVILPGVEIGEGAAVGACSLVLKSCDEWTMNVGIPAKFVKKRSRKLLEYSKEIMENK